MMLKGKNRKAQFMEIDAILAVVVLVAGLLLIKNLYIHPLENPQVDKYAYDMVNILNTRTMGSLDQSFLAQLEIQGISFNENEPISRQLAILVIEGHEELARELAEEAMDGLIPSDFGYKLSFINGTQEEELSSQGLDGERKIVSSSRVLLTGLQRERPVAGYTGSIRIADATEERSTYYYFGGFIGQGNITVNLDLPSNLGPEDFTEVYLEGGFQKNFDFYLNGYQCEYEAYDEHTHSDDEPILIKQIAFDEDCVEHAQPGTNEIEIKFTEGELKDHYISGGFARISYITETSYPQPSTIRKHLPGIKGAFNLYDSFYVPGKLEDVELKLNYRMDYGDVNTSIFFSIANETIHRDERAVSQEDITINVGEHIDLDYENATIPFRFGYENATSEILAGGNADIVLITDFSDTMKRPISTWNDTHGHVQNNCEALFSDPEGEDNARVRRTDLAQCVGEEFLENMFNVSGNRVWPVFIYRDRIIYFDGDASDGSDVIRYFTHSGTVSEGRGAICMSCAINKGYELLDEYSEEGRSRFMIVMTNGVPSHCNEDGCEEGFSSDFGSPQCEYLCEGEGRCHPDTINQQCSACISNPGASNDAIFAADRAVNDLGVTLYSIGFGPVDACQLGVDMLEEIAEIGNGTYQQSSNVTGIRDIYENISAEIIQMLDVEDQVVIIDIPGSDAELFSDSYVEYSFIPYDIFPEPGSIVLGLESDEFGVYAEGDYCSVDLEIPGLFTPLDGRVISYSGRHWTDRLEVNDRGVYDLQDYGEDYYLLGDPFMIGVPPNILSNENTLDLRVFDMNDTVHACSPHNKLIYTASIPSVFSLRRVYTDMDGCHWNVQTVGTFKDVTIPSGYAGNNECYYNESGNSYDSSDGWQALAFDMFEKLDFNNNNIVDIDFEAQNLEFRDSFVDDIPFMWEPSVLEVVVWQ